MQQFSPNRPLISGTILEGHYKIISLIKAGGMGAVYKALDERLDSIIALKELIPPFGDQKQQKQSTDWFEREAKILAKLDHANLPKVSDYFVSGGRYYLVMTFVDGEDLETILNREGEPGLPEEKVIEWTKQVLLVLDYLHNQKPPIVYRDIKPANIMLHKDNRVMLIDFGIARTIQHGSQTTKTVIGTPGYSPVEQYKGKVEPRSDIYSLGATMHHLIAGLEPVPFKFEPLRKINPKISPELESIVIKTLKDDLRERFSSAEEMMESLNFDNIDNWNKKGMELYNQGKYGEAIRYYDKALEKDARYYKAWNNKGIAFHKQGKIKEAVKCYDKALEINPGYTESLYNKKCALRSHDESVENITYTPPHFSNAADAIKFIDSVKHSNISRNPNFSNAADAIRWMENNKIIQPTKEGDKVNKEFSNSINKNINDYKIYLNGTATSSKDLYENIEKKYRKFLNSKSWCAGISMLLTAGILVFGLLITFLDSEKFYCCILPITLGFSYFIFYIFFNIMLFISQNIDTKLEISYSLDKKVNESYIKLCKSLETLMKSHMLWEIINENNTDKKYIIKVIKEPPNFMKINIKLYQICCKNKKICFLPDRIIVLMSNEVKNFSYNDLYLDAHMVTHDMRYTTDKFVPKDAEIVSWRWLHERVNGGPDRRYSYNTQIPTVRYGKIILQTSNTFITNLEISNPNTSTEILHAVSDMRNLSII